MHGAKARRAGRGRQARAVLTDIAGYRPADIGFRIDTGRKSAHLGTFGCSHKEKFWLSDSYGSEIVQMAVNDRV